MVVNVTSLTFVCYYSKTSVEGLARLYKHCSIQEDQKLLLRKIIRHLLICFLLQHVYNTLNVDVYV